MLEQRNLRILAVFLRRDKVQIAPEQR